MLARRRLHIGEIMADRAVRRSIGKRAGMNAFAKDKA